MRTIRVPDSTGQAADETEPNWQAEVSLKIRYRSETDVF